ncbi:hypothetical protein [Pseudomonas boanensis]|uniref:hypothetical protein n=1 Tax=Metapseudomonas boanensis TaxID=2822138 RepID=UPI0035D47717
MMIDHAVHAPRRSNELPWYLPARFLLRCRKALSLLLLSMLGCFASTAALAQPHLRAHWVQEIEEEATFVGVLSRSEDEDVQYVDLHFKIFARGMFLGSEVHRVELDETVTLFSLPVGEDIDCYEIDSLVGFDSDGLEISADDASPGPKVGCRTNEPTYF